MGYLFRLCNFYDAGLLPYTLSLHCSYQRGIANSLTGMRLMHVLEDSSSGRLQ